MSANHRALEGQAWQRARRAVLKPGAVCWLCGQPIDFRAPARSPMSPSVDHVVPLHVLKALPPAEFRRRALDPANLRPAHYGHNSGRQAKRPPTAKRTVSRQW